MYYRVVAAHQDLQVLAALVDTHPADDLRHDLLDKFRLRHAKQA